MYWTVWIRAGWW